MDLILDGFSLPDWIANLYFSVELLALEYLVDDVASVYC